MNLECSYGSNLINLYPFTMVGLNRFGFFTFAVKFTNISPTYILFSNTLLLMKFKVTHYSQTRLELNQPFLINFIKSCFS